MATKLPQDDLINIEEKLKEDYFLDSYIIVCTVLYLKMPFLFPYLMNLDLHKNVEKSIIFSVICFLSNSLFYLALKKSLHFISRRTLNIGMLHQPPHLIDFEDLLKEGSHFAAYLTFCSFSYLIMLLQLSYLMNLDFHKNTEECILFSIFCFLSTTLFSFALKKSLHFIRRCTLYTGILLCCYTCLWMVLLRDWDLLYYTWLV